MEARLSLNDFPSELLAEIFLFSVSHHRYIDTRDIKTWNQEPERKTAFSISHTCSYWRAVATQTPGIWAILPTITQPRCITNKFQELISSYIERSKAFPLVLTIYMPNTLPDKTRSIILNNPSIQLVVKHANRWKEAAIHLHYSLFGILQDLAAKNSLPVLESLHLKRKICWGAGEGPYEGPSDFLLDAPSLRKVCMDEHEQGKAQIGKQIKLPWNQLIFFTGFPHDLGQLRPASHLKELTIVGPLYLLLYPLTPIELPELQFLRVYNPTHQYLYYFGRQTGTPFCRIRAPKIIRLEIVSHRTKFSAAPRIIDDLLSTTLTSAKLLSLTFDIHGLTLPDFKRLLEGTPSLISLCISRVPLAYFDSLIVEKPSTTTPPPLPDTLVPYLSTLHVQLIGETDTQPLLDLFDSRRAASLAFPQGQSYVSPLSEISATFSSYTECKQAINECDGWGDLIATEGVKSPKYAKANRWCKHLAKQFLGHLPDKARKYSLVGTKGSWARPKDVTKLNEFFTIFEAYKPTDLRLVVASNLDVLLHEIATLPASAVPGDTAFHFRQRAGVIFRRWSEETSSEPWYSRRRWEMQDDNLTLKIRV